MQKKYHLKTPKGMFSEILIHVADNLTSEDKTKFRFLFRDDIPREILEEKKPLVWFEELERRGKISLNNLGCLEEYLEQAGLIKLLNDVKNCRIKMNLVLALVERIEYRTKGRLVVEMPVDREISKQQSSKYIMKKCKNLIDQFLTPCGWNRKNVVVIFNKTVKLFVKSCQVEGRDPNMMACKVLYLANQLFLKFGSWLLDIYPEFPIKKNIKQTRFKRQTKRNRKIRKESRPLASDQSRPVNVRDLLQVFREINRQQIQLSEVMRVLMLTMLACFSYVALLNVIIFVLLMNY